NVRCRVARGAAPSALAGHQKLSPLLRRPEVARQQPVELLAAGGGGSCLPYQDPRHRPDERNQLLLDLRELLARPGDEGSAVAGARTPASPSAAPAGTPAPRRSDLPVSSPTPWPRWHPRPWGSKNLQPTAVSAPRCRSCTSLPRRCR